ncbi:MAG: hypothetical protein VX527_03075 [Planctomycetota bacterium]|nr:hypothetical protein [Planctomycetota bacterium]
MSEVRRHPRRRLVILLIICSLLLLGWLGVWILLRPGIVASFVTDRVGRIFGGDVVFQEAQWLDSGALEIKRFQLRAPGLAGEEGLIAEVDSLLLDLSFSGIAGGDVVRGVEINGALLRLAEDQSNLWSYNINQLQPEAASGGSGNLPAIKITGLRLETGTFDSHEQASWELVGSGVFQGQAEASEKDAPYQFELTELRDEREHDPIKLQGELDSMAESIDVSITGVSLDQELKSLMPALAVRNAWDGFDLEGSLDLVEASFKQGEPPQISLALKDVDLVLPESYLPDDQWVHYHQGRIKAVKGDPRLHVDRGVIQFSGDSLELKQLDGYVIAEKEGEGVASVPYVINLTIGSLPNLAALDQEVEISSVLERASFDLRLKTNDFQFEQGGSADLPIDVADIFVLFGVQVCTVDINLRFWREASLDTTASVPPVLFEGRMVIDDAAGAFARFPYPLRNLSANISFDDKIINLEKLTANGSGESTVEMYGEVSSVASPSVNIKLEATDLPLDAALINAMPLEARSMMRSLFGRHGATSTVATDGDASGHELVGLDLNINRPEGPDLYTTLSGLITFDQLKITWDGFPYPIELGKGRMDWNGDELKIENASGDGPVMMHTAGGGAGTFEGTILLPDEDRAASGQLELDVRHDQITPELLHALEKLSPEEASVLINLGLGGSLDYVGKLAVIPGSSMEYDLALTLEDGLVRPNDALADQFGLPGPVWPVGFELEDVEAVLRVTPETIHIDSLHGHNALTNLDLDGEIHASPNSDLDISLVVEQLPMSERFSAVFPEDERDTLLKIWEAWNGRGHVTVLLTLDGRGAQGLHGTVSDVWIETEDGHTCRLSSGSLTFDESEVTLDSLELTFQPPHAAAESTWLIEVDGLLERGAEGRDVATIQSDHARFGSPILSEIVSSLMADASGEIWRSLKTDGWFKGAFQLDTDQQPPWELVLEPMNVSMTHQGEEITAQFDSAFVKIDGSGAASGDVTGESNIGWFDVDASARPDGDPSVDINFEFDGRLGEPAARAILPAKLGRALEDLGWQDGDGTRIQQGKVTIQLDEAGEPVGVVVSGDVAIHEASMDLGVEIRKIQATLQGRYEAPAEGAPTLDVLFESPQLEAVDRPIVDIRGSMQLSEDGSQLLLPDVRGTIADGAISIEARLAMDPDDPARMTDEDDWSIELLIANADLLRLFGGEQEEVEPEPDEVPPEAIEGRVYMSMFLGGHFDDVYARRGRGHIRIIDAVLGDVPVVVGIQQILHLTAPMLKRPDFVDISYYVNGGEIVLDNILIESGLGDISVFSLQGEGTFDWRKGEISAELVPRGGWMLVDDIIGLVQDHLYAVGISGPIKDPKVDLVPFPGLQ